MTTLLVSTEILEEVVLPICICVILPCMIVFFVQWARRNEMNRKTEVALKAIEKGMQVDPDFFASGTKTKTRKEKLFKKVKNGIVCMAFGVASFLCALIDSETIGIDSGLLYIGGAFFLLIGAANVAAYFIGRKHFAAEIKAEEDKIGKAE